MSAPADLPTPLPTLQPWQCFCFVCDTKAGQCEFWGTGDRETHHCNAHHTGQWDGLRLASRNGNKAHVRSSFSLQRLPPAVTVTLTGGSSGGGAAAAAAGGGAAAAGGGAAGRWGSSGGMPAALQAIRHPPPLPALPPPRPAPAPAPVAPLAPPGLPPNFWSMSKSQRKAYRKRQLAQQRSAMAGAPPRAGGLVAVAAPKGPQPMPSPAFTPDLLHLGQLRLPVKSVKTTTIAALQSRLQSNG